jgi:septum formation protein
MLSESLKKYNIILGSASPRRRELLAGLGLDFKVADPDIDEDTPPEIPPEEVALYLALGKAAALDEGLGSAIF